MVRKQVFTAEDVVQAGFNLVDQAGIDQLSARNLAQALGSSTAPVYSNFQNMEELGSALVKEAVRILLNFTKSGTTENVFLNIGIGVLDFTWQHPRWYEALFVGTSKLPDPGLQIMEELLHTMATLPEMENLPLIERTIVLKKMAVFTHGMATEICTGRAEAHSREEWLILMEEVGETILNDAFSRKPRTQKELETLGSLCHCSDPDHHNKKGD
ncbi:MAG: TetR/AcrR family transcriptional regulator [bacterium]|nr:TetR/AcrR family transcriptional regulator [bacterium]